MLVVVRGQNVSPTFHGDALDYPASNLRCRFSCHRKKRAEQLARAFDVHPAIIMFPEYEAKEIERAA